MAILDTISVVAAASFRLLRGGYTGPCLRVRRSSDGLEQDIGFAGTELDESALLAFIGSGDGFIRTWYDQSGNSRDLYNLTPAYQPKIVDTGSVIKVSGVTMWDSLDVASLRCDTGITPGNIFLAGAGKGEANQHKVYTWGNAWAYANGSRYAGVAFPTPAHSFTYGQLVGHDFWSDIASAWQWFAINQPDSGGSSTKRRLIVENTDPGTLSGSTLYLGARNESAFEAANIYVGEVLITSSSLLDSDASVIRASMQVRFLGESYEPATGGGQVFHPLGFGG